MKYVSKRAAQQTLASSAANASQVESASNIVEHYTSARQGATVRKVHSCAGLALTFAGLNVSGAPSFWRVKDQPMLHRQPLQVVQKLWRL